MRQNRNSAGHATQTQGERHQSKPPVVISFNCTKAITVANYNELAKLVTKQKKSQNGKSKTSLINQEEGDPGITKEKALL